MASERAPNQRFSQGFGRQWPPLEAAFGHRNVLPLGHVQNILVPRVWQIVRHVRTLMSFTLVIWGLSTYSLILYCFLI